MIPLPPIPQEPYIFNILLKRSEVVTKASRILHVMAESRFDGENARYVNNMQFETDSTVENSIIEDLFETGIDHITTRIEPYVMGIGDHTDSETGLAIPGEYELTMRMPYNWKRLKEDTLKRKMEEYLAYMIIAHWLEKVSHADIEYCMAKADALLREVKWTCELRQGKVHSGWNTTY
jgi:hypothetical protein